MTISKQEISIGTNNMNEVVVLSGLKDTDRLYLSVPVGYDEDEISLLPALDGKRNLKKEEVKKPTSPQMGGKGMRGKRGNKNKSSK